MSPGKSGLCPGPGHLIWKSVPFSLWGLMSSHSQQVVTLSWWNILRIRITLKVRCQFPIFYIHLLWDLSEILHISRSVRDLILRSQKSVILLFYFSISEMILDSSTWVMVRSQNKNGTLFFLMWDFMRIRC